MTDLLAINIGLNPNLGDILGVLISWHGVFTAIGIIAGVWLAVDLGASDRVGIDLDTGYTIGMIVVICGIVGARALYVIENYGDSPSIDSVGDIFAITEGGISIYGAIIGGAIGGWAYALWKQLPAAAGADAAAMAMPLGLADRPHRRHHQRRAYRQGFQSALGRHLHASRESRLRAFLQCGAMAPGRRL